MLTAWQGTSRSSNSKDGGKGASHSTEIQRNQDKHNKKVEAQSSLCIGFCMVTAKASHLLETERYHNSKDYF